MDGREQVIYTFLQSLTIQNAILLIVILPIGIVLNDILKTVILLNAIMLTVIFVNVKGNSS